MPIVETQKTIIIERAKWVERGFYDPWHWGSRCCVFLYCFFFVLRMNFEFDILEALNRLTAYIVEVARLSWILNICAMTNSIDSAKTLIVL